MKRIVKRLFKRKRNNKFTPLIMGNLEYEKKHKHEVIKTIFDAIPKMAKKDKKIEINIKFI